MIRLIYRILSSLKLSTLYKIATLFGIIAYLITPSRRKVVQKNCITIGISPTPKQVRTIYINVFKSFMEFFHVKHIDESFILNHVVCEDDETLFNFIEKETPFIAISGHLGSWEFSLPVMAKYFKKNTATIGRRIKSPTVDELVTEVRSLHGNSYIKHRNAVPKIIETLNNNTSIGALLDHSATPKSAIYVELFGVKTSFIAGVPLIAVKKNRPVLPVFLVREDDQFKLIHYSPIYPDKKLKPKERIIKVARDINIVYEDVITKYHDQWFMLHKRFKRTENSNGKVTNDFYR